jgi:DTW domain-containing protein YfiP
MDTIHDAHRILTKSNWLATAPAVHEPTSQISAFIADKSDNRRKPKERMKLFG